MTGGVFLVKTIAVQRGLEQIKDYLDNMGYKTVFYDDINSPVDAFNLLSG